MEYSIKRGGHRDLKRIYPMIEFDFEDWERPTELEFHGAFLKGGAEILLLKDEDGLEAGYAVMLIHRPTAYVMLGWLSVYPTVRGGGIGGKFLTLIKEFYADKQGILLEITQYPELEKARRLHAFYSRNGWRDVACTYSICDVESGLMWLPINGAEDIHLAIQLIIREVYSGIYNDIKFRKFIKVREIRAGS